MQRFRLAISSLCFLTLSGCASLLTPYLERSTRKEPVVRGTDPRNPPVGGISLGATRRLVVSNAADSDRFTCSEPPPDTGLDETLKSAVAASLKHKAGGEAGFQGSDEVVLTNIILAKSRTEIVELWRTTSYNYCLLLMNGKSQEADTYLKAAAFFATKARDLDTAAVADARRGATTGTAGPDKPTEPTVPHEPATPRTPG